MSTAAQVPLSRRWNRPPLIKSARLRWALGIGAAVYFAAALGSIDVNWLRVWEGLDRGWAFILGFLKPDFVSRWTDIKEGIAESLVMTVTSTAIGILISVPIGLGAARNIAPLPVYLFCRGIIAISRSFQEIIIAGYRGFPRRPIGGGAGNRVDLAAAHELCRAAASHAAPDRPVHVSAGYQFS
jgi:phosphonate transport system permease protein